MSDVELLERYAYGDQATHTPQGCWTNWLGLHTRTNNFDNVDHLSGRYISEIPINGDGVYGPANEYVTLLTAIRAKENERDSFTAVELGAGWGPWISAAGVICKRLNFSKINLVGVEAHAPKAEKMREHLIINGLSEPPVNAKVLQGVAWHRDATVYFPQEIRMGDYGGAPVEEEPHKDWRGQVLKHQAIDGYSLETICGGLDRVDYGHWDIAGAEFRIAEISEELLQSKFWHLMIGTHSRKIEGDLLNLFLKMKWDVLRHDPCHYKWDKEHSNLEAMTLNDGVIFVRNPNLDCPGKS